MKLVSQVLEYHTIQLPEATNTNCVISFHYDVRKYSFTPRIVNTWNSLPDYVVMMMMMMKLSILPCAEKLELVLSTAPKT